VFCVEHGPAKLYRDDDNVLERKKRAQYEQDAKIDPTTCMTQGTIEPTSSLGQLDQPPPNSPPPSQPVRHNDSFESLAPPPRCHECGKRIIPRSGAETAFGRNARLGSRPIVDRTNIAATCLPLTKMSLKIGMGWDGSTERSAKPQTLPCELQIRDDYRIRGKS
jgi:hypothetical protein